MHLDHYCVYFDHRYAPLGLAMLRSLRAHGSQGTVWVLCLSPEAEAIVRAFDVDAVRVVTLTELEGHFAGLPDARIDRSTIEYYFTLTPHLLRYVLDTDTAAARVAYLDSDLYFFDAPDIVWAAQGDAPVAILPHNFHAGIEHLKKFGTYNVSWVSFDRSEQAGRCLDFWVNGCREWCRDTAEGFGRFADQGYLDRFHEFAPDLAVVRHKGCNVGPWNVGGYRIRHREGRVWIDEDPLVFFHFTGFKKGPFGRWYNQHRIHRTGTPRVVRDHIYRPYLQALLAAKAFVAPLLPAPPPDEALKLAQLKRARGGGVGLRARAFKLAETGFRLLDFVTGSAIAEGSVRKR